MKRRQFLNGLTAATISGVAMAGCKSESKPNSAAVTTPTPVATPTPSCPGGDPTQICFKAQMLMIFMLGFSQTDPMKNGELFINRIFPDDNSYNDFANHHFVADLKVDAAALQYLRDSLVGTLNKPGSGPFAPKDVIAMFQTVHDESSRAISYTGSDCPSRASLVSMIANAQGQTK